MSIADEQVTEPEVGFDADLVERRARIFRFGHFPGKNRGLGWTCTREDFVAFNGESGTVPIGVDPVGKGHYLGRRSVFDGRTGRADYFIEGDEVYATLRTPPMVMESALEHGLKISGVFRSAADKTLTQVDLVEHAHFDDAVIFAEEAGEVVVFEDEEPAPTNCFVPFSGAGPHSISGQLQVEPLREFEVPEPDYEAVEFCKGGSCKGHEAYQTMHDLASHGRAGLCSGKVGFAREKKETDDDRLLRQMHHHAVHNGAYCPGMPDGIHEEIGMTDELDDEVETTEDEPEEVAFTKEDFLAMQARIRQLEARDVAKDAVAFAKEVTTGPDRRATTQVQKKAIEEGYARAAEMDAIHPEAITFTDDKGTHPGTHVEAFKALVLGFPKVGIVGAKVKGQPAEVAFTVLDEEPSEGAEHRQKEDEARERRRELNHEYAARHNPAAR